MLKKVKVTVVLPDLAEFLNASRRFIRDIELLDKTEEINEYK